MACYKCWIFILAILISACDLNAPNSKMDLNYLYYANPVDDVKEAISKKDYRFYGISGMSLRVPHIPRECINIDTDVKIMPGNAEVTLSYEEKKFNALAQVYVDNYNFYMMLYLKDKGLYKCSHSVKVIE